MLKYCKQHDLCFCEKHGNAPCFTPECVLTDAPPGAIGCSHCVGIVLSPGKGAVFANTWTGRDGGTLSTCVKCGERIGSAKEAHEHVCLHVRQAYAALKTLTPEERSQVLCWFCAKCYEYIPPGGQHRCAVSGSTR